MKQPSKAIINKSFLEASIVEIFLINLTQIHVIVEDVSAMLTYTM